MFRDCFFLTKRHWYMTSYIKEISCSCYPWIGCFSIWKYELLMWAFHSSDTLFELSYGQNFGMCSLNFQSANFSKILYTYCSCFHCHLCIGKEENILYFQFIIIIIGKTHWYNTYIIRLWIKTSGSLFFHLNIKCRRILFTVISGSLDLTF